MEMRLRNDRNTMIPRENKLYDIMDKKYGNKITEADLLEDIGRIHEKFGEDYANGLAGCVYIAEDFAWIYYRKLHTELADLSKSGKLGEKGREFKPILDKCREADKRYHQTRQRVFHDDDRKIDLVVERCFDKEFGVKMDFFQLEMCCDNVIKKHYPEDPMTSVRKYALMVIVMIELSFDMFNYAEKMYAAVDIRYKIDDENAVRRQNGITNRLRKSMELILENLDIDEVMKGNLNTSRGVFKAKLIAALNHESK